MHTCSSYYDRYLKDPNSVDDETRALFATWTPPAESEPAPGAAVPALGEATLRKAVLAVNLAQSIRKYGHLAATLDPLGSTPIGDPSLNAATHDLTDDDLRSLPPTLISSPLAEGAANMLDVVNRFRALYCSTSGHDYSHVFVPNSASGCGRRWSGDASAHPPTR